MFVAERFRPQVAQSSCAVPSILKRIVQQFLVNHPLKQQMSEMSYEVIHPVHERIGVQILLLQCVNVRRHLEPQSIGQLGWNQFVLAHHGAYLHKLVRHDRIFGVL